MKSLYITHYGILEPLGQSQILPYLLGLAANGCSIQIISFEKPALLEDRIRVEAQKDALLSAGISWYPHVYHGGNSLFRLLKLILRTSVEISQRCKRDSIDLLHCRSHVPCLMAWLTSARHTKPMLFDFRGFMAEEYADSGLWKAGGFRFRAVKAMEKILMERCAAVVVLTEPAGNYLGTHYCLPSSKIFQIPCCADLTKYTPAQDTEWLPRNRPLRVVYSGSTSGRYDLPGMVSFFEYLLQKRPGSHFTILTTGDTASVYTYLQKFCSSPNSISVLNAPHHEVARNLATQDLGLLMLKGDLGLKATSPTKVGEYLASGLVVVAEEALGDMHKILVENGVGCLVDSNHRETWETALDAAIGLCDRPDFRKRSRSVAQQFFDLNMGVQKYLQAYEFAVGSRK
jgi:glycosyltransferase involved in cell wall biosynthesis